MIIGDCHVQGRLQVWVGPLLQQLCSEVGQAMPTGCVQWGFSLNRNKWPWSEHFRLGAPLQRDEPSLYAVTQVPNARCSPGLNLLPVP